MKIKFLDLKAQYKPLKKEIDKAIQNVINSSQFIMGEDVMKLEREVAGFCGTKYAVALGSGTDALFLSVKALDIGSGDEVITTPFTFISPAEVVAQLGAKPVFCDIDPKTFNIDPSKIPSKITKKTRAIIPVHLFGQMAEMDSISNISQKAGLEIIEDAAQAIGATYKKKQIGGFGKIACLSFYPTKNLGGYGDGGMAVSDNKKIADKIAWLRIHGSKEKYYYNMLGYGARLDTIQAAILRVKLKHLRKWTRARQKVARIYDELLSDSPIAIPYRNPNCNHVFHIYCIRAPQRDGLRDYLAKKDIPTFIYYPLGLHLQEAFRYLGYRRGSFPETEKACRETLALPIYPEITTSEQEYVCEEIKKFYKK